MRFSRPVVAQNPRPFEPRRDASNGTCVCHSRTNVVSPDDSQRAPSCSRCCMKAKRFVYVSTVRPIRLGITPALPRTSECGWPNTTEAAACTHGAGHRGE